MTTPTTTQPKTKYRIEGRRNTVTCSGYLHHGMVQVCDGSWSEAATARMTIEEAYKDCETHSKPIVIVEEFEL